MRRLIILVLLFSLSLSAWAGSQAEESATSGKYFAERGMIIPPEHIRIDSYIATYRYNYPYPDDDVGVYLYTGHRQISNRGQEEVLQIGIQAKRIPFEELPTMNLAFVVDKSGSMYSENKMDWVKESFDIFISRVRSQDFVSLIIHDDKIVEVLFPSTQMDSDTKRKAFSQAIHSVKPGGAEQFYKSLKTGYEQVQRHFDDSGANRVLFITDGRSDITGMYELAEEYKEKGIQVSAIGVGSNFDSEFIVNLARSGGGSSRFIADKEEMRRMFGSELDRMIVPVAYDLEMKIEFLDDVEIIETWGYEHKITGNTIQYSLRTLHNGDYETILVNFKTIPQEFTGERELARFSLSYADSQKRERILNPRSIRIVYVEREDPVTGFSDGMVLKSGTMMHFAQALLRIGHLNLEGKKQEALQETIRIKKEVNNARMRLDEIGFEDQIKILNSYIDTLGNELNMADQQIAELKSDIEISPSAKSITLTDYLEGFCSEIAADLSGKGKGIIAVTPFAIQQGEAAGFNAVLDEAVLREISKLKNVELIRQREMENMLKQSQLTPFDLIDTSKAIELGKNLLADFILTGSLIEMRSSVIVFGRILNTNSGNIESVAQIIIPKDETLKD
jgi:Ca-activated chloride channel family protein